MYGRDFGSGVRTRSEIRGAIILRRRLTPKSNALCVTRIYARLFLEGEWIAHEYKEKPFL